MIVNCRIEISDEQANALAVLLKGKPTKARATRKDFNEFVAGCVAALPELGTITPEKGTAAPAAQDDDPDDTDAWISKPAFRFSHRRINMAALVERARKEDAKALAGKSDGFVVGWCRVKYRDLLQAGGGA